MYHGNWIIGFVVVCSLFGGNNVRGDDWQVTMKSETYLCGEVDITAFFAKYEKSVCIAYDWKSRTGSLTFTLGLGVGAGGGLEVGGWGARTAVSLGQRFEVTVTGKKTTDEIVKLCGGNSKEGVRFRNVLLNQIKSELLGLPDNELRKLGMTREAVQDLSRLPAFDLIVASRAQKGKFESLLRNENKVGNK